MDETRQVRNFRITPFDSPIGTHLPDRLDWEVVNVGTKDMRDQQGTEVHRFGHWTVPSVYVRIRPPGRA